MDAHVAALIGPQPSAFHIESQSEAEIFSLAAGLLFRGLKVCHVERVADHIERLVVLAAVEGHFQAVGKQQALARVGKLLLADEIATAYLKTVEAQLLGKLVHGA